MSDDLEQLYSELRRGALTRRQLLQRSAMGAGTLSIGSLLVACGGGDSSGGAGSGTSPASGTQDDKPRRGGTVTTAYIGAGSAETLTPIRNVAIIDGQRNRCLYDPFVTFQPDNSLGYVLAESLEPNARADEWTLRLREGVTFHDGSPLTADDAAYSFRLYATPGSTVTLATDFIDVKNIKKLDNLTLRLPLKSPNSDLPNFMQLMCVVKDGYRPRDKPNGTGPFRFKSFTAGRDSVFVRNPEYWQEGKPYLDEVKFVSIPDQAARLNALLGGQVDAIESLNYPQAKQYTESDQISVLVAEGPNYVPIYMATTLAPFDDVRVRQAMRLIADRPQLIEQAQLGFGEVGNDLFGQGHPDYNTDLAQREQDIEQAKSLLKAAGKSDLSVTLYSSTSAAGMLESATVFAGQAEDAGVSIKVQNVPASDYFGANYLKQNFAQSLWFAYDSVFSQMARSVAPNAPFNETHWDNPEWSKLYRSALATTDEGKRSEMANELQKVLWDEGGYIYWGDFPLIDGLSPKVRGVVPNSASPLGNGTYEDWWLAS